MNIFGRKAKFEGVAEERATSTRRATAAAEMGAAVAVYSRGWAGAREGRVMDVLRTETTGRGVVHAVKVEVKDVGVFEAVPLFELEAGELPDLSDGAEFAGFGTVLAVVGS